MKFVRASTLTGDPIHVNLALVTTIAVDAGKTLITFTSGRVLHVNESAAELLERGDHPCG